MTGYLCRNTWVALFRKGGNMRESAINEKWIGQRFGRLTICGFQHSDRFHKWFWVCRCDCGEQVTVRPYLVRNGHTLSCGCLQKDRASQASKTHGQTNSRLYHIYSGMKNRCYNEKHPSYANYGGKGITICDEWLRSFAVFQGWALANGYSDDLSIDRIDNDKGYSPENCRWATRTEQNENTRNNHLVTINGKTQPLSAWARERELNYHTVSFRIHQKHMTPEQALEV